MAASRGATANTRAVLMGYMGNAAQADAAARSLLRGRTQWVAVTSAAPDTWAADEMQVILVTANHTEIITHPRIPIAPKGTGDLFCATLTGHWLGGATLADAARRACRQVVLALQNTQAAQSAELLLPQAADTPQTSKLPAKLIADEAGSDATAAEAAKI